MNAAIEIKNLSKKYGQKTAVDGLILDIFEGELFSLLGVNGAGKSTTVKMLSCITQASGGDAILLGDSINSDSVRVKAKTNLSPQETAVARNLTVAENLEFAAGIYGMKKNDARLAAEKQINDFGLRNVANSRARTLSGGYARRLSIAMALISNPKILFLDEPTVALDVIARREMWRVIEGLKGKVTIVLTTHYMEEAEALSDRIGIMAGGKLCALGTAEELKALAGCDSFEDAFIALASGGAE